MAAQQHVGILDKNKKLTQEAKESFISQVLLILEYGTENIPADKKPPIPFPEKIEPSPNFKNIKDVDYLKDEKKYPGFHKTWITRYEKLANDLNLNPNYSFLPAFADPISLAKDAFNVDIPPISFPGGYMPYFTGLLPAKLIGNLIDEGKTDFLSPTGPANLIKTMVEKKAPPPPVVPAPPIIIPPAMPPGFSLPKPDINFNVDLTPDQILANSPKPPEVVFSSLSKKEFAAVENIPKIVVEIIGKIPSLIGKLNDPKKVVGEVAVIVKKSGVMGPPPKEFSFLEKAADAVLTVKLAEMFIVATLATTIGSAPGSATTGITQVTSANEPEKKYIPMQPVQEKVKEKKMTPGEKAKRYGIGLGGSYYGSSNDGHTSERERYLSGLFYAENYYRSYPKGSLNVYGEFVTDDPKNVISPNNLNSGYLYSEQSNEVQRDATPVIDNTGFFKQAERAAGELSSCGMFVRGCLQAGGAANRFFVSMYAAGKAIQILINIGIMRNYRWVSETCVHPNYEYNFENPEGGRAIINDLYDIKLDDKGLIQITPRDSNTQIPNVQINAREAKVQSKTKTSNTANATVGDIERLLNKHAGANCIYNTYEKGQAALKQDEFRTDWSLNKDLKPNLYWLEPYLKPRDKRSLLWGFEIGEMLKDPQSKDSGFPALQQGDAILINKLGPGQKYPHSHWIMNGEHVLLVTEDREHGYEFFTDTNKKMKHARLRNPIIGIEGGALDDYNTKEVPRPKTFKKDSGQSEKAFRDMLKRAINTPDTSNEKTWKYQELYDGISQDKHDEMIAAFESNKEYTLYMFVEIPKPSAILQCKYDRGEYSPSPPYQGATRNNYSSEATMCSFFVGTSNMARSNPALNSSNVNNMEPIGVSARERKIIAIFKTNNYCNEAENLGPLAPIAIEYMDDVKHNSVSTYFKSESVFNVFAFDSFPGKVASYRPKK